MPPAAPKAYCLQGRGANPHAKVMSLVAGMAAGADSIAVVSDVTQNADPDMRVKNWLGASAEAA